LRQFGTSARSRCFVLFFSNVFIGNTNPPAFNTRRTFVNEWVVARMRSLPRALSAAEALQTAGADPACRSGGKDGTRVVDEPLTSPSHSHPPGPSRTTDCGAGCTAVGHLPSTLLQMGETCSQSPAQRGGGSAQRTPEREDGPGEGIVATSSIIILPQSSPFPAASHRATPHPATFSRCPAPALQNLML
jgi:hypothetical protein